MEELVIKELKRLKDYEVFFVQSEVNETHLEKGRPHFISKTFDSGYGIRVLDGGLGFSSSNVKEREAVRKVIESAAKSARMTEKVDFQFPFEARYPKVDIVDKKIKSDPEKAINETIEKLLHRKPDNMEFSFGKFRTYDSTVHIMNSEGLDAEREETAFMIEMSITVGGKKRVEFWPHEFRRRVDDFGEEDFDKWFKLSRDQLTAELPGTGGMTVIFSPGSVADGVGSVVDFHTSGRAKLNEMSKFSVGEKIASEDVTIHSDGLYPFGLMSSGFDDEGVPQQKLPLIEKGVFKNFTYDQFYALKDGTKSTGNGLRQSDVFFVFDSKFGSMPTNQISNLYIKPGKRSLDELIGEVKEGVLVEKFSWLNPDGMTGDFSSEISAGYRIKNGEIANPVKGGLVSGNLIEMMRGVSGLSDKSTITSGGTVLAGICPYIRFEDVQVAG
ncbi:hypothetical protein A3K63_02645 [Candidatus Micrarchaeota archaeon RBG_16_49_10]|nr:MAG: hypothetical protein A3K63_02645 [Candidatus Micrarchaeota archaeon RBG_16_49_10]